VLKFFCQIADHFERSGSSTYFNIAPGTPIVRRLSRHPHRLGRRFTWLRIRRHRRVYPRALVDLGRNPCATRSDQSDYLEAQRTRMKDLDEIGTVDGDIQDEVPLLDEDLKSADALTKNTVS
jgi:hypothetical protein